MLQVFIFVVVVKCVAGGGHGGWRVATYHGGGGSMAGRSVRVVWRGR